MNAQQHTNTSSDTTPEGYRKDAQGRLVPEDLIKPIDKARDELVLELVAKAKTLQTGLIQYKATAFGDIEAFVEMSAEEYGVKLGGKKGNVSLLSFDGRYKVVRAIQESITFDERLQAAKSLIDQCLHDWTENTGPEIRAIIGEAFRVDTKGEIRTARVLALRRLEISDGRWQKAMQAISEACQVTGSKSYVRLYERVGASDRYQVISLDLAGV
ncbi:Protein of unknown function [Oceanospirillum multiglobuliferum]|uniref:Sulfate transporter n=1 Tax=Oceanospirillum multiglobuliferum TaxID=64969 RepID=A0A1T4QZA5_9GAMM|nr:DUF3164 family protein [Oceanospirillum multiglobuliferum]OPX57048.1 sulfate transporter [Oceanospirillum multiglobuliferum]SKA08936.1 Protein of unknown function [Oceanospirillum multiglobuliferum]